MTETVTVREDDLRLLMEYAGMDIPVEDGEHEVNIVLARCAEALEATDGSEEEGGTAPEPSLPPGRYARVEIPGFRQNTGWVTEETRFGVQCAVVRDWSGVVEAEVVIGPGSRVVYLPTYHAAIVLVADDFDPERAGRWRIDGIDSEGLPSLTRVDEQP